MLKKNLSSTLFIVPKTCLSNEIRFASLITNIQILKNSKNCTIVKYLIIQYSIKLTNL